MKHARTGKVIVTSNNKKLKPWRQEVAETAMVLRHKPFAQHVPVTAEFDFYFVKPKSVKKRATPTVKPDVDKLLRAMLDGLKGVIFHDDAQVVSALCRKHYGSVPRVELRLCGLETNS